MTTDSVTPLHPVYKGQSIGRSIRGEPGLQGLRPRHCAVFTQSTHLDPYSSISSFVISFFSFDSPPLACRGLATLIPPAFTVNTTARTLSFLPVRCYATEESIRKSPSDWKRPPGRPNHMWLQAIDRIWEHWTSVLPVRGRRQVLENTGVQLVDMATPRTVCREERERCSAGMAQCLCLCATTTNRLLDSGSL